MTRALQIECFRAPHARGVTDLILPIQQVEFAIEITLDGQPDLQSIAAFYQRDRGNFWVALDADEVVGTIGLLDIGEGRAALRKMFVKATHRGREHGVANRLLDACIDWARSRDISEIFLGTTAQFLAAHRFYEKRGFHEIARDSLPKAFPVMSVDTKFYAMKVSRVRRDADDTT